ncbi:MAG: alpha-amylase family glycosyl hydrolase, partial [Cyclobacteriaceae bacterium]
IKGPDNPYRDYYVWADPDSVRNAYLSKGIIEPSSEYIPEWHTRENNDEIYYGFFWQGMPDLNYDNPKVREEVIAIGKFWLQEVKVDGFRLDAALYIYPKDEVQKTVAWWEEFRTEMETINEDVYLVGEVWAETETTAPFLRGLDAVFNFDMGFNIVSTIRNETDSGLVDKHKSIRAAYASANPGYVDALFLTNHDQNRIMSELENDEAKAKLAASLLLTLPGSPYIYYGEELGMRGEKPDEFIREPFLWKEGTDPAETSWGEVRYNTKEAISPLSIQREDPSSIYNLYKELIALRNLSAVLTYGDMQEVDDQTDEVISFTRYHEGDTLLVMHNLTGTEISADLPTAYKQYKKTFWKSSGTRLEEQTIAMAPYGSLIIKKK